MRMIILSTLLAMPMVQLVTVMLLVRLIELHCEHFDVRVGISSEKSRRDQSVRLPQHIDYNYYSLQYY